jgi:hypothetical protein
MGTLGWVLIAVAFLMFIMVANNSWPWVWAKIGSGMPQPGQGNPIVPPPTVSGQGTYTFDPSQLPRINP